MARSNDATIHSTEILVDVDVRIDRHVVRPAEIDAFDGFRRKAGLTIVTTDNVQVAA